MGESKKEILRRKLTKMRMDFRGLASEVTDVSVISYLKVIDDVCAAYEEYIHQVIKESARSHND